MTLMGHPQYAIVEGQLLLDGESLHTLSPDDRAKR
jgi:Fe-S cluster assembly ATPase SufC